ncbi:MAG: hypothetical protein HZC42_04305 [Candidatus Eisenbacteria bacterium]|nr:hypothetical protein [Candidatus Eisenbacteria bacterium]
MKPRVLIVEDDHERAGVIRRLFAERFDCHAVGTVEEALAALADGPWAAAVVDYDLARGGSGLEVLQTVLETAPGTQRLLYTSYFTPSLMRDIVRLAQPQRVVDARDVNFLTALRRSLEELLAEPVADDSGTSEPLSRSQRWTTLAPASAEFIARLRSAAESHAPVFLHGEPGTGRSHAAAMLRHWRQEWKARGAPARHAEGELEVVVLRVPPLRERLQDLPTLAARCLAEYAHETGTPVKRPSKEALDDLLSRDWRGNIVELASVLLRACRRAGARRVIQPDDLPRDLQPAWRPSQYAKDEGQRDCVLRQLRTARNVSGAARLEGCSRANYIRLMRRLGIIRADLQTDSDSQEHSDPGTT